MTDNFAPLPGTLTGTDKNVSCKDAGASASGVSISVSGRSAAAKSVCRVLGIDPGLAATGFGIIEYSNSRYRYITHGVIETKAGQPHGERLLSIFSRLTAVINEYQPHQAGMETLYFAKNVTSAMAVSEARGVISLCLAQHCIPLGEYSPLTIKQSVSGTSKASKEIVQQYVKLLLGLEEIPKPDHAADALAAAITHIHAAGSLCLNSKNTLQHSL